MNVIKLREVLRITKCSKSFWHGQIENGTAPKPIKLSDRAVSWVINDATEWLEQRINQSKQDTAA
ncbi:helix-turn-helix transcriptional regulator [Rheinheimera hassiensis]|uniref:helix-turn-helix transcriptional regulator n=1 Tax=Rheinheimera hassiensis TaxID=1193627 RepID=UPI003B845A1D